MDRQFPKRVTVRLCQLADKDHQRSKRTYAHTYHRSSVVCVARAFNDLPPRYSWAILAHEVGHLIAGPEGSEEDADRMAEEFFKITMRYHDSEYGKSLQTVSISDAQRISKTLLFIFYSNQTPR